MSTIVNQKNVEGWQSAAPTKKRKKDDGITGFLFALPHLILFTVFLLAPTVYGLFISVHQWHVLSHSHPFVGFANYQSAIHDDIFWLAFRNTVYFVILAVPLGNLASLLLAIGISNVKKAQTFYKICYYVPTIISVAVVAILWSWMYNTQAGLFNLYIKGAFDWLKHIGLASGAFHPIPWLAEVHMVMPSIALMSIWWGAGGNMILYLAGINNISKTYYEAARIDGASSWQQFWAVTWPMLKPTTLFCMVFSVMGAFQVFSQSYVLYGGASGPGRAGLTLALYMFQQGFGEYEIGYGTAIAYLIFAMILIMTLIQFKLLGKREEI